MAHAKNDEAPADRLTETELLEIGEDLGGSEIPALDPLGSNRRRFERVGFLKSVQVTELDDFANPGASWDCRVVDLSRGGLGLRSRRMVHKGRCMLVEVAGLEGQKSKVLFGVVRQSRYAEGEGYAIGLEFKSMPKTASVRLWLSQKGLAA